VFILNYKRRKIYDSSYLPFRFKLSVMKKIITIIVCSTEVVYVAAQGALNDSSEERGIYKPIDGGTIPTISR
jgi:hypothetical protein